MSQEPMLHLGTHFHTHTLVSSAHKQQPLLRMMPKIDSHSFRADVSQVTLTPRFADTTFGSDVAAAVHIRIGVLSLSLSCTAIQQENTVDGFSLFLNYTPTNTRAALS